MSNRLLREIINRIRTQGLLKILILVSLLIFLHFFSSITSSGNTQNRQEYGRIWKSLNHSQRHFYLGGLQEGTHELLFLKCLFDGSLPITDPEEQTFIEEIKLTHEQRNLLVRIIGNRLDEINLESFGADTISDVMTNIYDDPANNFIGFKEVAKIAVMKLKGKKDEDIKKELEILRRASAEVMKKIPKKP